MNKITFPLKRQMQGPQVADLQDARHESAHLFVGQQAP
jgi:hypothetical protein